MSDTQISKAEHPPFRCTLILPTYNALDFIEKTVVRLRRFVADHPDWFILFVCDGCPQNTAARLHELVDDLSDKIKVIAYEVNRGKGYALRMGLSMATTPYKIYTDCDLAYDPEEGINVLKALEAGADLALVNRANPQSQFVMSPLDFPNIYKRHLMSRSFNWWLRRMLPIDVLDTQAGLKGITAQAWERLSPQMTTDGFFFDVEFLARAGMMEMRIDEVPVLVRYIDPTTVRMVSHGWKMIKETVRLRSDLRKRKVGKRKPAVSVSVRPHGAEL